MLFIPAEGIEVSENRANILEVQDEDEVVLRAIAMSLEGEEEHGLQLSEQIPSHVHEKCY